ncbi:nucleoside triphosphate pyrophosphohydrolase [Henriciella mobilis]|uniref:Nucleoside triphosphate pyrophosphohydrolase n=1 Tax=Henriciella mobilis TaxID=2305467 RepID=A0A399RF58_9PROT|nr:nucleoside triphosphate pyrophosphohydrolase [Henriciella mobilis]RIJ28209.1 nucleoside triphosphate pyrophosphohydrolase [Henriciella mobilis]
MVPSPSSEFDRLKEIMAALRDPDSGCPWDIEQDFASIAPYTIEEAYEVADAIDRGDFSDLRDELGDLLLQVVFHSQMAAEAGLFTVDDVAQAINNKMVRRHPHVFRAPDGRDADGQTEAWEAIKAQERADKAATGQTASALDGVARALPALMRAEKLQKRAARTGFDWKEPKQILDKLAEESDEVAQAIEGGVVAEIEDEIGDLLFVAANLARRFRLDPEIALRKANAKFERRFRAMESLAASRGQAFDSLTPEEQDRLWKAVKAKE